MIPASRDIVVLDDSFNSNPVSSKVALEVLGQFKKLVKVIITPGMIELGDDEEKENKEFGKNISRVCDYVILVGKKRTKPIFEGLMEESFRKDRVFIASTLDEATSKLKDIPKPLVVLYENDLPDTFNEQ